VDVSLECDCTNRSSRTRCWVEYFDLRKLRNNDLHKSDSLRASFKVTESGRIHTALLKWPAKLNIAGDSPT
jgi:hypothetical protein